MAQNEYEDLYVPDIVPEDDLRYFRQGGYGARMGWGNSPAVLVVDMMEKFTRSDQFGRSEPAQEAIENLKKLLDEARSTGTPILYTKLPSDPTLSQAYSGIIGKKKDKSKKKTEHESTSESDTNSIVPKLQPAEDDIVIVKSTIDGFFDTPLANVLRRKGIDTLVVTGASTSGGVRATTTGAICNDFRVVVPKECVTDRSMISHDISLFDIDMKYGDVASLSEVVEKLRSYPAESA